MKKEQKKETKKVKPPELPGETAAGEKPAEVPSDTTDKWVKDLPNLQPKQGEVRTITQVSDASGLKGGVIQKETARKVLTIQDGAACWIHFDEDGKQIRVEKVPGH